jgi:hypothetical protein
MMPEDKDPKVAPQSPQAAEQTAKALADAEADAEKRQADETVPGGRFKVGDDFVDAEGKPIKAK